MGISQSVVEWSNEVKTKIEWTNGGHTWNPIKARLREAVSIQTHAGLKVIPAGKVGYHCERISPGCGDGTGGGCYAECGNCRTLPSWGTGLAYNVPNRDKVEIFVDQKVLLEPSRWKTPQTAFVCSMTDLFADFVTDAMIDDVMGTIAYNSRHRFQILTKRHDRMRDYMSTMMALTPQQRALRVMRSRGWIIPSDSPASLEWPPANCWIGVSAENDRYWRERVSALCDTPAAFRFVSVEPYIGRIEPESMRSLLSTGKISLVIFGGESGRRSRPLDVDWIREGIRICREQGVMPFVKQLGAAPMQHKDKWLADPWTGASWDKRVPEDFRLLSLGDHKGGDMSEWPIDLRVRVMPDMDEVEVAW